MSHDWPWLVVLALVIPPALGHLYHFVLMINVGSGFGLREPVMDKVRELLFALLVISSALLLWMHLRARGGAGGGRSGVMPCCAWYRAR